MKMAKFRDCAENALTRAVALVSLWRITQTELIAVNAVSLLLLKKESKNKPVIPAPATQV